MPFVARHVSVTNAATLIIQGAAQAASGASNAPAALLHNLDADTVYLGGAGVTTAAGYPLAAGAEVDIGDIGAGDDLYGIVASGTADVAVLEVK